MLYLRKIELNGDTYNDNKTGPSIEPCGTTLLNVLNCHFLLTGKSAHDFTSSRPGSQTNRHYMSSPIWQGNQLHPYATSFYCYLRLHENGADIVLCMSLVSSRKTCILHKFDLSNRSPVAKFVLLLSQNLCCSK